MRASLRLFPGLMQQVYGMTEPRGVVSLLDVSDHEDPGVAHRLVSAGRAIEGVEIEIRDPGTGQPHAAGQPGDIWVRSERLMGGYRGQPQATAAAINLRPSTPTAGCARATAVISTPTVISTSPTASRTSSSAAATTSTRPKSQG